MSTATRSKSKARRRSSTRSRGSSPVALVYGLKRRAPLSYGSDWPTDADIYGVAIGMALQFFQNGEEQKLEPEDFRSDTFKDAACLAQQIVAEVLYVKELGISRSYGGLQD